MTPWELLERLSAVLGLLTTLCGIGIRLWGFLRRDAMRLWLRTNRFSKVGGLVREDAQWAGILFKVSRAGVPRFVMETAKPNSVAFSATQQSQAAAEELEAVTERLDSRAIGRRILQHPVDPKAS